MRRGTPAAAVAISGSRRPRDELAIGSGHPKPEGDVLGHVLRGERAQPHGDAVLAAARIAMADERVDGRLADEQDVDDVDLAPTRLEARPGEVVDLVQNGGHQVLGLVDDQEDLSRRA